MRFRRVSAPSPAPAQLPPAPRDGSPSPAAPVALFAPLSPALPCGCSPEKPVRARVGTPPPGWRPGQPAPHVCPGSALAAPEQRGDDLSLLRALVGHLGGEAEAYAEEVEPCVDPADEAAVAAEEAEPRDRTLAELAAFSDMLAALEAGGKAMLSKKQRAWAVASAERREVDWGDPAARNRAVPRGEHVALLVDAMARPLAPPGRKPTELPGRRAESAEEPRGSSAPGPGLPVEQLGH